MSKKMTCPSCGYKNDPERDKCESCRYDFNAPTQKMAPMAHDYGIIMTTTPGVEGRAIAEYIGVLAAETVMGAGFLSDLQGSVADFGGGRASGLQAKLAAARLTATKDLVDRCLAVGADAIVGIDIDYNVIGSSILVIGVNGTAVKLQSIANS